MRPFFIQIENETLIEINITRKTVATDDPIIDFFSIRIDAHHPTWQMETFPALLAFCVGNSPVTSEFLAQRPLTRNLDVSLISTWTNGWVNNRHAGDFEAIAPIMTSL